MPFAWMAVASLRPNQAGAMDIASLLPAGPFGWSNFADAWTEGKFPLWYLNTVLMCGGILAVQCVTISLAGYAFARLHFRGRDMLFHAFLLQLMLVPPILIVPNMTTLVALHLYDTLPGIMAPYFASAFGVFLMRQTFRTIPRDYEEAALVDGAGPLTIIIRVLLPLARPGLAAFAIVSVTSHWNEFLWPLMAVSSPSQPGVDGRAGVVHLRRRGRLGVGCHRCRNVLRRRAAAAGVRAVPAALRLELRVFRHQIEQEFHHAHGSGVRRHARRGVRPCPGRRAGAARNQRARRNRDRHVLPGAGAGQARRRDAAADRAVRRLASRHPRHRRLYRQLRRHQPEDPRGHQGRPPAGGRDHVRQFHPRIRHQQPGHRARRPDPPRTDRRQTSS